MSGPGSTPTCDICSSTRTRVIRRGGASSVVACRSCGLHYRHPKPEAHELAGIYDEHYFRSESPIEHGYEDYGDLATSHMRMAARKARFVSRRVGGGRLLDLGAAYGFFVRAALAEGFDAEGLELSEHAAQWARTNLGVPVRTGTLEHDAPEPGSFDAVTLWDVLEHTIDARETLGRVRRLLAPGGCVFFSVPDARSLWALAMGRWWFGYNKEEHVYFFSRRALKHLVEDLGLTWVGDWTCSWSCSIQYAARRIAHYSPLVTSVVEGAMAAIGILESDIDFPLIDILAVARRDGGPEGSATTC